MLPPPLPPELSDSLPPVAQAYIRALDSLTARVAEREARLGQSSANSSKPPSSDGPHVTPAPPQPPSGKKRGGQPGHPRHERVILPPDEVFDHRPTRCRRCAAAPVGDDPNPIPDQVLDLPAKLRHVVRHRRHALGCPCRRTLTTAAPVPEAASGFGPKLTAVAAYLTGVGRPGKRAVRTPFADACDIPVSLGSASTLEATVSRALDPIHAEAHDRAKCLGANVGETSWKEGTSKAWLWVAVTEVLTVFPIRPHRNRAAFDDRAGPDPGVPTAGRFPAYTHLAGESRQVCRAHLRRDFRSMIDRKNAGSTVGEELLAHADIPFAHWPEVRDGTRSRRWFRRTHAGWLREQVRLLLERGSACGRANTEAVCRQLLAVEASLWTFAGRDGIGPTNSAAERAVRHAGCWRRTSFGTDSERGSRFVERMLTVVASCRQQGRGVLDFLVKAVTGAKPSLLPQEA